MICFLRVVVSNCTVGAITQVTISDVTFPFNYYDINQFNSCLSASVVQGNLEALTQKVVQPDYLSIVLSKLQQVRIKPDSFGPGLAESMLLLRTIFIFRLTAPPPSSQRTRSWC